MAPGADVAVTIGSDVGTSSAGGVIILPPTGQQTMGWFPSKPHVCGLTFLLIARIAAGHRPR